MTAPLEMSRLRDVDGPRRRNPQVRGRRPGHPAGSCNAYGRVVRAVRPREWVEPDRIRDAAMSGRIVYTPAQGAEHGCDPPMRHRVWSTERTPGGFWTRFDNWAPGRFDEAGVSIWAEPGAAIGAVWLCDCGEAWVVRDTTPSHRRTGGYSARRVEWARAGWWTRRKARKEVP
jgi:hypothetical protein